MNKKTVVNIVNNNSIKLINISDSIITVGSCFSSELAKKLKSKGAGVYCNPFGTIYNSYSIYRLFKDVFSGKKYDENDIIFENNKYLSFNHSCDFESDEKGICLKKINDNISKSKKRFCLAKVFIITLGTSVVYKYDNEVVANCHRLPHNLFERGVLSVEENVLYLNKTVDLIKQNIEEPLIIFTLSPVRHTPDDLALNCYSKSLLRVSLETICNKENIQYFPSYEIVIDQLRDYSFYKKDGIHLRKITVTNILDIFINNFYDIESIEFFKKFDRIRKILNHKPKIAKSEEYFNLLFNTYSSVDNLIRDFSLIRLDKIKIKICYNIILYFFDNAEYLVRISELDIFKRYHDFFTGIISLLQKPTTEISIISKIKNKYLKKLVKNSLIKYLL